MYVAEAPRYNYNMLDFGGSPFTTITESRSGISCKWPRFYDKEGDELAYAAHLFAQRTLTTTNLAKNLRPLVSLFKAPQG